MHPAPPGWSPESWRTFPHAHDVRYDDEHAVDLAADKLRTLPPLVTSWEIERLKRLLAEAEAGKRFVLQGGDCAETLADCGPATITAKLKILLQMSLVLVHGLKKPVVRIGRFAGQYAKPRSSPVETRDGITLPSYFGDLVNGIEFTTESRRPDPARLVAGYHHAAATLNFIRSLTEGGFADLHHPEYWDLSFFHHATLSPERRREYERMSATLADGLRFMEALGERDVGSLSRVEFYTSHEGLNLRYESSQTRRVPRREGYYDLTTHLPWIGERTRALDGAHVEFFRGIENPVGVKIGPRTSPDDLVALARALNPRHEPGKLVLITRLGRGRAPGVLPPMIEATRAAGTRALWMSDPMHGNAALTSRGAKTRSFDDILVELEETIDAHRSAGSTLAGVHFELTGEDVAECVGGAAGVTEDRLTSNLACDPRLNYQQSLELAFLLASKLGSHALKPGP